MALQMSLSKFYDQKYSNIGLLAKLTDIGPWKKEKNDADLNDLLKDTANDFTEDAGTGQIIEKGSISYTNSLHTK